MATTILSFMEELTVLVSVLSFQCSIALPRSASEVISIYIAGQLLCQVSRSEIGVASDAVIIRLLDNSEYVSAKRSTKTPN